MKVPRHLRESAPMLAVLAGGLGAGCGRSAMAPAHRAQATPVAVHRGAPPAAAPEAPATCTAEPAPLPGFATDDRVLPASSTAPSAATTAFADGHLRLEHPAAWFARRIAAGEVTAFQFATGNADDRLAVILENRADFTPSEQGAFRLALGPLAVRGSVHDEDGTHVLDALVRFPCGTPRYAHLLARSHSAETASAFVALLRSLRWSFDEAFTSRPVTVDAHRDADRVAARVGNDAVARELVSRALAGEGLQAAYPLETDHPLADQRFAGAFALRMAGVPTEVRFSIAVQSGTAHAPAADRALFDGSLDRAVAELSHQGCRATALLIDDERVGLRCATETDLAAQRDGSDDALVAALQRLAHARATLAHWRADSARAGGFPASMCPLRTAALVTHGGGALYVGDDRCVAVLDAANDTVRAVGTEGDCADVPNDAWGTTLRTVGRFDEVRDPHNGYCHLAVGWNGRSGWVIAVGDQGTTSAPLTTAPSLAVDRRAVNTAVAFVHDLVRYARGAATEAPANVRPTVLHDLSLDRIESAEALATLRAFGVHGGFSAAAISAVVSARAVDEDHVEVTFVPARLVLTRESGGWVVTEASIPRE